MRRDPRVLVGRRAVDAYRRAHAELRSKPWHRGIPEEHTPLLNSLLSKLREQGFNSVREFFDASNELNIQEVGLKGKRLTKGDVQALEGMWF